MLVLLLCPLKIFIKKSDRWCSYYVLFCDNSCYFLISAVCSPFGLENFLELVTFVTIMCGRLFYCEVEQIQHYVEVCNRFFTL